MTTLTPEENLNNCFNEGSPTFRRRVKRDGALKTAQHHLATPQPASGLSRLWGNEELHKSLEAIVLRPEFQELFTDQELETARERLAAYNYEVSV